MSDRYLERLKKAVELQEVRYFLLSAALILFVYIVAQLFGDNPWEALTAIGTLLLFVAAVWGQELWNYWHRAVLSIEPFRNEPPMWRLAPHVDQETFGHYANIMLVNRGRKTAKNCQPVLTRVWTKENGSWVQDENWLPLDLLWVLDEQAQRATGRPTRERDIIPTKPYYFNLCSTHTAHPDRLILQVADKPTAQDTEFRPGEYRFEVRVFGEVREVPSAIYEVNWKGDYIDAKAFHKTERAIAIAECPGGVGRSDSQP